MKNIVLIGMPGSGKSTVGVVLAKTLNLSFIDVDLVIQQKDGRKLQEIINNDGVDAFLKIEEECIKELDAKNCVIATGGSAVLSDEAMRHLKENAVIVYIKTSYYNIKKRIHNLSTRGIALKKGQTLMDIYNERTPLYEKYADITVKSGKRNIIDVVNKISERINR